MSDPEFQVEPDDYWRLETVVAFTDVFCTLGPHKPNGIGESDGEETSTYSQRLYSVYRDEMGGFVGIWQLCILAAHAFNHVHKDTDWSDGLFYESILGYAAAIDRLVFQDGDPRRFLGGDPIKNMAREFPRLARLALDTEIVTAAVVFEIRGKKG